MRAVLLVVRTFYAAACCLLLLFQQPSVDAFSTRSSTTSTCSSAVLVTSARTAPRRCVHTSLAAAAEEWNGDVVPGEKIRGCTLTQVGSSLTEFTLAIDGVDADLGRFSEAIYKKLLMDAKQQRFQGFRPGTVPPHLEPTYRTFAMDECARETVLEAMQQNSIRPFENCRSEMKLENFSIPPAPKKKKKSKKRKKSNTDEATDTEPEEEPVWKSFATMKEAIDAGWKPGQSFSFVARGVKGQRILDDAGATPVAKEGFNF